MEVHRVGDFNLSWGESLVWDENRNRLYFVDCLADALHWLDDGKTSLSTLAMPSLPAGVVLTIDGLLVVVLDDGLYLVDPDHGTINLLSAYPGAIDGRCNDACADFEGNIITGVLNFGPGDGSAWQYSTAGTWTLLDDDISNSNGQAALTVDGQSTLVIGDTAAQYYAYDYNASEATVGPRRVFGDVTEIDGVPDGSAVDSSCGLWCALPRNGSQIVRFTTEGFERSVGVPCLNPTDVAFAGPDLDRLYVTSIGHADYGAVSEHDGALLMIEGLGFTGRTEPRARFS